MAVFEPTTESIWQYLMELGEYRTKLDVVWLEGFISGLANGDFISETVEDELLYKAYMLRDEKES